MKKLTTSEQEEREALVSFLTKRVDSTKKLLEQYEEPMQASLKEALLADQEKIARLLEELSYSRTPVYETEEDLFQAFLCNQEDPSQVVYDLDHEYDEPTEAKIKRRDEYGTILFLGNADDLLRVFMEHFLGIKESEWKIDR